MSDAGGQSRSPTQAEVLRQAVQYFLEDLHVMLPGRVETYDAAEQKVTVKPLVQRRLLTEEGEELIEELPVIPDVPVAFPRSRGFFLSFPMEPGDLVMLIFAERSIDNWLAGKGEVTDPDDFRLHDLTDAVAYPGMYPFGAPIKDIHSANMVLGKDDGGIQIHITPDGKMQVKIDGTADEAVALGNKLKAFWDGPVTVWAGTHVHPTGVGPTGFATPTLPAFDTTIISGVLELKSG